MWVDATVAAGFLASSDAGPDIAYALAPVGPVAKGNAWLWSWSLAVPSTSEHANAALRFITWATSKDYIELVAAEKGWASIPPGTRISTYERTEYLDAAPFAELPRLRSHLLALGARQHAYQPFVETVTALIDQYDEEGLFALLQGYAEPRAMESRSSN